MIRNRRPATAMVRAMLTLKNSILRKASRIRVPAPTAPGPMAPVLAAPPQTVPSNVFVTPQTLVTFPVASAVVFGGWQLAIRMGYALETSYRLPVALALLWGAYLFYLDVSDPERKSAPSARECVTKVVVALVNALFLATSALGVGTVASERTASSPRTPSRAHAPIAGKILNHPG